MDINTISDFRAAMRNGPYAWPGGYPLFFVTNNGDILSFKGAKQNIRNILEALKEDNIISGWRVSSLVINWEEPDLYCDVTGEFIESAYHD